MSPLSASGVTVGQMTPRLMGSNLEQGTFVSPDPPARLEYADSLQRLCPRVISTAPQSNFKIRENT